MRKCLVSQRVVAGHLLHILGCDKRQVNARYLIAHRLWPNIGECIDAARGIWEADQQTAQFTSETRTKRGTLLKLVSRRDTLSHNGYCTRSRENWSLGQSIF